MTAATDDLRAAARCLARHLREYADQLDKRASLGAPDFLIEQTVTLALARLMAWNRIRLFDSEDAREMLGLGPRPEITRKELADLELDPDRQWIVLEDETVARLKAFAKLLGEKSAYSEEVTDRLNCGLKDDPAFFRIARDARAFFQAIERHESLGAADDDPDEQ